MRSEMIIQNDDGNLLQEPFRASDAVQHAVRNFEAVSLEEMDGVKLMDRFDKKYVFPADKLPSVLRAAQSCYRSLEIGDNRIFGYASLYYDTVGYRMYHDHHNQKLNRFKVRKREYLNSGQVFLEIKYKTNKGQTRKKRIETANRNQHFEKEEKKFIKKITPYRARMLYPALNSSFSRITLVNINTPERVTIDMNLNYKFLGESTGFPNLVVAEVKQDRSSGVSEIEKIFRDRRIHPMNFSKYCMGIVMMKSGVKYNRFKQKFLTLKKINNDSGYASFDQ